MKRIITAVLLLFIGGLITDLCAQESIKALIKRCENTNSVDMSYIINKDPQTKKVLNSITTITITDNPRLVKDFIGAFEKDRDNAYSVSGSIKNGVSIPSSYKFSLGDDGYISCSMTVWNDNANASVSYRESSGRPGDISLPLFENFGTFDLNQYIDQFREQTERFINKQEDLKSRGFQIKPDPDKNKPDPIEYQGEHS